jgi:hypothetical protein
MHSLSRNLLFLIFNFFINRWLRAKTPRARDNEGWDTLYLLLADDKERSDFGQLQRLGHPSRQAVGTG